MKKNSGRRNGIWFAHRENPVPGEHFAKPHMLFPVLDATRVKMGVLTKISKTPRLRIPRHMEHIMALGDVKTRLIPFSSMPGDRQVIALDIETVHMLRKAGATLLKQSYRHELMGSPKAP